MSYPFTRLTTELGLLIKPAIKTNRDYIEDLDALKLEVAAAFDDTPAELAILRKHLANIEKGQSQAAGLPKLCKATVESYLKTVIADGVDSTRKGFDDVFEDFYNALVADSQTFKGNQVSVVEIDNDTNRAGNGSLSGLTALQTAINRDLRLRCTSAATEGAEVWELWARPNGGEAVRLYSGIVTGEQFPVAFGEDNHKKQSAAGIQFTIDALTDPSVANDGNNMLHNLTASNVKKGVNCDTDGLAYCKVLGTGVTAPTVANDGGGMLASPSFTGPVKGTNTDGDGKIYVDVDGKTAAAAIEDANDGSNQLSGWSLTGPLYETNTDTGGLLYVSLTAFAATITEANDNNNQLSDWGDITGVDTGCMDINGKSYISIVDDGGGFFHVDIYNDVGRTGLIGHTGTYNGAGAQAIVEDNSSGLGGTITVDAATAADVDIEVTWPWVYVKVYKDSGLGAGDLVCFGQDMGPNISDLTLDEENTSGITGEVDVAFTVNDTDISLTLPFVQASVYMEVGKSNLVAQSVWTYAEAASTTLTLAEQNSSGLSGSVDITFAADDGDIYYTLPFIRFEVYRDSSRSELVAAYDYTYDADADISGASTTQHIAESNDGSNQITIDSGLTGVALTNVDDTGVLYVKIESDGGGYYHVDLYKDSSLTDEHLVGHTATYNTTGDKAVVEDNSSGLGGVVTIDAVSAVDADIEYRFGLLLIGFDVDFTADDSDIVLTLPSAFAVDDEFLIETREYVIANDGSSQLSGYEYLYGVDDNVDANGKLYISIIDDGGGYYHVNIYSDSGRTALIGHTATYNAVGEQAIVEDNASGLGGRIVVDAVSAADADIYVNFSWGRFQTFFRDHFGVTLPNDTTGSETIADTLAE